MSVESVTKSPAPAAPLGRGTGRPRAGRHPAPPRTGAVGTATAPAAAAGQRARASRAWYLGIVLGLLGLGLVGLLLLNTASAQDAFRLHDLQTRAGDLSRQEQSLALQAAVLADPGTLAGRAGQLGMVPGGDPRFLAPGAPLPAGCQPSADGCVIPGLKPGPQPTGPPTPRPSAQPTPKPSPSPPQPSPAAIPTAQVKPTTRHPSAAQPSTPAALPPAQAAPKGRATPGPAPALGARQALRHSPKPAAEATTTPARSTPAPRGAR